MTNLLSELGHLGHTRIRIDDGFVLDLPGTVSIAESVEGLFQGVIGGGYAGQHYSVGVAAQGVWGGR